MKNIIKLVSSILILALFVTSTSAGNYVTPEKYEVTEYLNNYNVTQNNSYQLACHIGQYVSEQYGWNCDIRQLTFSKHAPVYINVFYPAADNKKGYEAYYGWFGPQRKEVTGFTGKDKRMYYRDWYEPGHECYISGLCSYGIVKSYFGNITEETVVPVESVEVNESTQPEEAYISTQDIPVLIVNDSRQIENSTVGVIAMNNTTVENVVDNSTNTVQNLGVIGTLEQYWIDLKNANLSNVTFNFFGEK